MDNQLGEQSMNNVLDKNLCVPVETVVHDDIDASI